MLLNFILLMDPLLRNFYSHNICFLKSVIDILKDNTVDLVQLYNRVLVAVSQHAFKAVAE